MEILSKKINVNGKNYEVQFVNDTYSNSNSWGHISDLFINGYHESKNKVRYYNRTWECYRYQTCMSGCLMELIEENLKELKQSFKDMTGINKLTKKYKDSFEAYVEQNEKNKLYEEIMKVIEIGKWNSK